jgi:hypothetical protein
MFFDINNFFCYFCHEIVQDRAEDLSCINNKLLLYPVQYPIPDCGI